MSIGDAAAILQAADPDRFAALIMLPLEARAAQVSLHALAVELARVPRASAEPMLAEIRLQWWVEQVERLPASAGLHPVLQALADHWRGLSPVRLAEGQRAACAAEPFADAAEALAWIDATAGELAWLGAQALGAEEEGTVRAQGRALGVAEVLSHGAPRAISDAIRPALRQAGLAAARAAASGHVPRAARAVLRPGAVLNAALNDAAPPSEFARRRSRLGLLLGRDWRFRIAD